MTILYIEDDIIDIKNCQLLMSRHTHHTVKIAKDFDTAISIVLNEDIDFVISDRRLGFDNFTENWTHFFGMPFFIVSNQPDESLFDLVQAPIAAYQKPIRAEHLEDMLSAITKLEQEPNMAYAENITAGAPEMLREMVLILKDQFVDAVQRLPHLYENGETEELIQVIHKLISKFSVISMKDSFAFFNLVEKYLRDGLKLETYAYQRLLKDLNKGIDFINQYIDLNELHNS